MDKTKQPGIIFSSIMLIEEKFNRAPDVSGKLAHKLDFEYSYSTENLNSFLSINYILENEKEEQVLSLHAKFVANFKINSEHSNMSVNSFLEHNAAALMFPYLREHVSRITSNAGIPGFNIPPINVYAFIENKKKWFKHIE